MRNPRAFIGPLMGLLLLAWVFGRDVTDWIYFGWSSDLYSYTLLVPLLVAYLIYPRKSIIYAVAGWILLVLLVDVGDGGSVSHARLYVLVTLILGSLAAMRGWSWMAHHAVPGMLLYLAVPLPPAVEHALVYVLQHGSSALAGQLLSWTGVPVYREGLHLALPGLNMFVAEACSGIRSTLVLLLLAAAGGCLVLRRALHRVTLIGLVIPVGMLRNALRIATLGWLSVYVDPGFMQGQLHLRGGPLFFIVSLVPLLALLVLLQRREQRDVGDAVP